MALTTLTDPGILPSLTGRLERLSADRARRWGTMSAHQMAVHLAELAEAALGRRPFGAPMLRPHRVTMWVALYLPLPWPRGIQSGMDPGSLLLRTDDFEPDRLRAITSLEAVAAAPADVLVNRHPLFGGMTRADWHRWAFLHVNHHLRQFGL